YGYYTLLYYLNWHDKTKSKFPGKNEIFVAKNEAISDINKIDNMAKKVSLDGRFDNVWIVWDQFSGTDVNVCREFALKRNAFLKVYRTTLFIKYK
ncbi:MAG TPA: hypothetical protein VF857_09650, partial [Spirochaetota bacterium]